MQKQRYINLRQLFRYFIEKIWVILLCCLIFGVALIGFGKMRENGKASSDVSDLVSRLKAASNQNRTAYYNGGTFTDNEMDDGLCNASARLYIEYYYDNLYGEGVMDLAAVMNKVQADARVLIVDDEAIQYAIDSLKLMNDEDMKNLDVETIRWLVNKNTLGSNIMQLSVTDVNEERAVKICNALIESFIDQSASYSGITSVSVVDEPYVSYSKISANTGASYFTMKNAVKFGVIGMVFGAFVGVFALLVLYIIFDSVRNGEDLIYCGTSLFDKVSLKESKLEDMKRVAYQIMLSGCEKVAVIPVDDDSAAYSKELVDTIIDTLKEENSSASAVYCDALKKSAATIKAAGDADGVLYVARYGKSSVNDVKESADMMEKLSCKKLGTVLVH